MLNILQCLRDKDKKFYGATGKGVEQWTHYLKIAAAWVNTGMSMTRTSTGDTMEASMTKFLNKVLEAVKEITDVYTDLEMFLCIIVGLTKASFSQLGFDISLLDKTGSKHVLVAWKGGGDVMEVTIDNLLFISDIMHGHGTTMWQGSMDDSENNSHSSNHQ
ncbi:hypothetical protein HD554DRAFT_2034355 [Boletus coccyginus]|nr:hypothetical protein HD554DRAFT_2034355 [Boletus coccyginus]